MSPSGEPLKAVDVRYQMTLGRFNAPVIFSIVYFWWTITTPFNRFPIFTDLRFELLLVFFWSACIFMQEHKGKISSPITTLLITFYFYLLIASLLSPYPNSSTSNKWLGDYWKKIVFFILLTTSIRNKNDFYKVLTGLACVTMLYQVHSWRDFIGGGSYVYQQGMKRMVAVWTAGGYGAGNFWGFLSVFTIPVIYYVYHSSANKYIRYAMLCSAPVLCASVVFSGSRGSLVSLAVIIFFLYWRQLLKPKIILAGCIIAFSVFPLLPEENRKRYTMIFVSSEEVDSGSRSEQIAKESAASRMQGMVDGWNLLLMRPIGVGPGHSPRARRDVNSDLIGLPALQLHNLYGQVLGETGVIGSLLMLLILIQIYLVTRPRKGDQDNCSLEKLLIRSFSVILLVYGMASHSLYDNYWIWLYAFSVALSKINLSESR